MARRLSGEGLSVFAGCYNPDGKGASQLRSEYSSIQILKLDITDDNSVDQAFAEIEKKVKDKGIYMYIYDKLISASFAEIGRHNAKKYLNRISMVKLKLELFMVCQTLITCSKLMFIP